MEEGRRVTPWTPSTSDQQLSLNVVNALDATFAEARQATTNIQGGLVLTNTIIAGEGTDQSGMTGAQSNNVAFWAGGTLEQAKANTAPVVINRNGNAKFGQVYIDGNGAMKMNDTAGQVALEIARTVSIATPNSMESANYPEYTTYNRERGQATTQAITEGLTCVSTYNIKSSIETKYRDFDVDFGSFSIALTWSGQSYGHYATFALFVYDGITEQELCRFSGMTGSDTKTTARKKINIKGSYIQIREYMQMPSGTMTYTYGLKYLYKSDPTQSKTVFAQRGLGMIVNSDNFFRLAYDATKKILTREYQGIKKENGLILTGVLEKETDKFIIYVGQELIKAGIVKIYKHEVTATGVHLFKFQGLSMNETKRPILIANLYSRSDSANQTIWVNEAEAINYNTWQIKIYTYQGNNNVASRVSFALYGSFD